jgi:SAM-dependent methyltransferase
MFGYEPEWLDRAPPGSVSSFAGVGNPHERADLREGETVLDLGSGAGLDAIIASWAVGPSGKVIGVDINPAMCDRAQAHAADEGMAMECHEGRMEEVPVSRRFGRRDLLQRGDQPVVPEAACHRRDVPRAEARGTHLDHRHRERP